jgi:hypothetical protein
MRYLHGSLPVLGGLLAARALAADEVVHVTDIDVFPLLVRDPNPVPLRHLHGQPLTWTCCWLHIAAMRHGRPLVGD